MNTVEMQYSYALSRFDFLPGRCPPCPPCPPYQATRLVQYGTYGTIWNTIFRIVQLFLRVMSIAGATLCKQFSNSFAYQIAFYKNNNELLFKKIVVLPCLNKARRFYLDLYLATVALIRK